MARIDGDCLFAGGGHFSRAVARVGEHAGAGSPEVGRRFALRTEGVEGLMSLCGLAGRPHRFGGSGHACGCVVARLASRLEEFASLVVGAFGDVRESLMKERESAAVTTLEGLERIAGLAKQSLADAEFHRRGRASLRDRLEVANGGTQVAVGGGVGAEEVEDCLHFRRAERAAAGDQIADVETGRGNHSEVLTGGDKLVRTKVRQ